MEKSTDFATAQQGLKDDTAIQSIKANGELINLDKKNPVNITPESTDSVLITGLSTIKVCRKILSFLQVMSVPLHISIHIQTLQLQIQIL